MSILKGVENRMEYQTVHERLTENETWQGAWLTILNSNCPDKEKLKNAVLVISEQVCKIALSLRMAATLQAGGINGN